MEKDKDLSFNMLNITALASGSAGNCYRIDDGESSLLIEAGLPIKQIKEGLNHRLSEVDGCLITHEHKDHCKAVEDVMKSGIDCYMSKGTVEALDDNKNINLIEHRIKRVVAKDRRDINDRWSIKPFEVEHDAKEPVGFLVWNSKTNDKLVYITDSFYSKYKFYKPNYIMVECNYSEKILDENVRVGRVPAVQKKRLIKSHFSLTNVKEFLRSNDLSKVKEIWLLHLSNRNSDEKLFKREIQEITGKPVYIA